MKNYFKLITIIFLIFIAGKHISAQIPKPHWAKNAIQAPESGKYIFVYGEGNGDTQESSINKAFANAVVKGQYELGSVTISAQDIATIEKEGLDAAMRFTNRQIKIACQTDPVIVEKQHEIQYKTYILIQMSLYADKSARFYDLPHDWDCIDNNYYNEMTQYNERMNKLKKAKEKEEKMAKDSFILRGFNQYFSFSLGNGVSYGGGNIIGLAFSGRFGGRFGIEPHISIGAIYQNYSYYDAVKYYYYNYSSYYEDNYTFSLNRSRIVKTKISYNVGVNAYVFKGFYLGINYGVQKLDIIDHYFDDYEKRLNEYENTPYYVNNHYNNSYIIYYNSYEGYVSDVYYKDREEERFTYSLHKGMSFIAGYKCYIGDKSRNGVCVYFDFGAGVKCYSKTNPDFGFEKFDFAWNLGFGIAF